VCVWILVIRDKLQLAGNYPILYREYPVNCIVTALQDCSEDILTNYNVSVFLLVLYVPIIFAVLLQKEFQLKFQVDAYDLAYQTYFYANEKSEPNSV
jgi:hypothetical protein